MNARFLVHLAAEAPSTLTFSRVSSRRTELVRRRLAELLRWAEATPFYRARFAQTGCSLEDLERGLPIDQVLKELSPVTKQELRVAGNAVLTGGKPASSWFSSLSSGSTGEPLRTYFDPRAWAILRYLVKIRARAACGLRPTDRVAVLDTPPRLGEAAPQSRFFGGRLANLNITVEPAVLAQRFAQHRPDAVLGMPSVLLDLGRELESSIRSGVRRIFTTGEILDTTARRTLERMYASSRVFDVYGCSETKEIGWECPSGGMHVNEDVVFLEIVDEEDRPVPVGTEGDVVATLLVNRAMPLIRYRIGDRGKLSLRRCPCGRASQLIEVITGRRADTLEFEENRRVSPYALTDALETIPALNRYQVVQSGRSSLRLLVSVDDSADRVALDAKLRHALREVLGEAIAVDVDYTDRFVRDESGKSRVVVPYRSR